MKVYLASKSPRRKELLRYIFEEFEIVAPNIDEKLTSDFSVETSVMSLSFQKAIKALQEIDDSSSEGIIISADTVVYLDDILVKPKDRADAKAMLSKLSGSYHDVYTGFSIVSLDEKFKITDYEKTRVKFKDLNDKEIEDYINSDEPYDKAGGYAIQGIAAKFIEKIDGDFYNVMGLPVCKLNKILSEVISYYE